jgi:hypothetical protein
LFGSASGNNFSIEKSSIISEIYSEKRSWTGFHRGKVAESHIYQQSWRPLKLKPLWEAGFQTIETEELDLVSFLEPESIARKFKRRPDDAELRVPMPELPQKVFPFSFREREGRKEVQVPQMREQKGAACVRRFFRQDFQEKLAPSKGAHPF